MELALTPELRHDGPVTPLTPPTGVLPRAALVMRLLHEAGPAGLRLSQLVQRTGLPQPTAHRLLADLAEQGAVGGVIGVTGRSCRSSGVGASSI